MGEEDRKGYNNQVWPQDAAGWQLQGWGMRSVKRANHSLNDCGGVGGTSASKSTRGVPDTQNGHYLRLREPKEELTGEKGPSGTQTTRGSTDSKGVYPIHRTKGKHGSSERKVSQQPGGKEYHKVAAHNKRHTGA